MIDRSSWRYRESEGFFEEDNLVEAGALESMERAAVVGS
jgi:hypothetical protein